MKRVYTPSGKKSHELSVLKSYLEHFWESCGVPSIHRQKFAEKYFGQTSQEALKKELSELKNKTAPIVQLKQAVAKREKALLRTQNIAFKVKKNNKAFQIETLESIEKLRNRSLEVVEALVNWRNQVGQDAKFEWEDLDYVEKMQSDVEMIVRSNLKYLVEFPKNCNTFFLPSKKNLLFPESSQSKLKLPTPKRVIGRVKEAMKHLGVSLKPKKHKKPKIEFVPSLPCLSDSSNTKSQSVSESEPENQDIGFEEVDYLLEPLVEQLSLEIAKEAKNEMISAALVLFSSNVLDKYITEVLSDEIAEVALETHNEETEFEYIDIIKEVINSSVEQEVRELAAKVFGDKLAEEIVLGFELPLERVVEEAIQEETLCTEQTTHMVFESILVDLAEGDWLEVLAENQLNSEKLEKTWKLLPARAQTQLFKTEKNKFLSKITKNIYFDILNDFVGQVWLENLVKAFVQEEDACTEEVMPILAKGKRPTLPPTYN